MKKKFEIILPALILSCFIGACGNVSLDLPSGKSDTIQESNSIESNGIEKYDEIVSIVDLYYKAQLSRDTNKAVFCCAKPLADKVQKTVKQLDKEVEKSKSELMDTCISSAQDIFYYADDYDDIIDAEYLRKDEDMQEAVNELVESMFTNSLIYSLPEKAKMVSDKKATVKAKLYTKDISGIETTSFNSIKDYLDGVILDKLVDNSNFIKKQIAKKVVKEELIHYIKDLKNQYEEETNKILVRTTTYHLKKKKGNWIITRIDKKEVNS